jgi:hypothetical protein
MEGPDSSYSSFEIHICWKVEREARMEPPIQTEYLRSAVKERVSELGRDRKKQKERWRGGEVEVVEKVEKLNQF